MRDDRDHPIKIGRFLSNAPVAGVSPEKTVEQATDVAMCGRDRVLEGARTSNHGQKDGDDVADVMAMVAAATEA